MKVFKCLTVMSLVLIMASFAYGGRALETVLSADYGVEIDTTVNNLGVTGNHKQAILSKTAAYTYQPGDGVLLVDTTAGEVIITLPAITVWPDEAFRNVIPIVHAAGTNNLKVILSGAEAFVWGNTYFNLGTALKGFDFAAIRNGANAKYGILRNITIKASAHRDASWASTNFSSTTIIPWDNESYNNQSELLVYTSGASARYTMLTAGSYKISYLIDIDSTGGSTWNATSHIYKNGVELANTEVRTGNYGSEDQSMALIPTYIDLAAGDYIDLRIIQSSLTGNLIHSVLNIEIRL